MARWVAVTAFFLATLCFAWVDSASQRSMASGFAVPLAPVGRAVSWPITIAAPEAFELEARVVGGPVDTRPGHEPSLPLSLSASFERSGASPVVVKSELRHSGSIGEELQTYSSSPVTLQPGSYSVRVTTLAAGPALPSVVLSLAPVREQASLLTLMGLARVFGWLMLAAGVVAAALGAWPNNSSKPTPLRGAA